MNSNQLDNKKNYELSQLVARMWLYNLSMDYLAMQKSSNDQNFFLAQVAYNVYRQAIANLH